MKEFKMNINGNEYAVTITDIQDDVATVDVNGMSYSVALDKPMRAPKVSKAPKVTRSIDATVQSPSVQVAPPSAASATSAAGGAGVAVKSPLPGVVLEVSVNVGDAVTVGKKLLVLEAMKMENIINADRDGKVIAIKANKGDSVMEGDDLVIIG